MEPKVKFKGFEGEWKKVELCSISKKVTTRNVDMQYTTTLTNSAEHGIIDQLAFFDHQVSNNDNISGYYVVENGDFVYNPRISALAPVGPINQSQIGYTGIMSPLYYVFRVDGVDTDYLSYYFKTTLWHQYLKDVGNSGARFDRLAITDSDFQEMPISLPTNREEQQSIASYFRTLDAKLQASAKKVESLKKLKSASLVALFPQNGESMPKVRFKGFEGEWDKQSASDLFLTIDERNRPELPVLSACQDVRGMIPRDKIGFNISHDTSNEVTYKRVQPGQFVIHLRSFQGGFAHSSYDGIISPAYTVFDFKNKEQHDDYYWKIVFMSRSFIERLRLITYGIRDGRSISFNEFKGLSFLFPSKEEQQAIATFFRSLDRKIALETARLEKLKQIKLACLDKMFV